MLYITFMSDKKQKVRITKDPEERREEIIRVAWNIFTAKGYGATRVSDIVQAVGVSQGTFYYYFNSKEEIIDSIVDSYISEIIQKVSPIVEDSELGALKKLERMADIQLAINMVKNRNIHMIQGADIHERIIGQLVYRYVPLQEKVFRQGIQEGVFTKVTADEVRDLLEIFVVAASVIFDPGIFKWTSDEHNRRIESIIGFMERSFGVAEKGTLGFYRRLMSGGRR